MYGYETPTTFRTGAFLAAHDLNVLRGNAIALDMLSLRIEAAFDSTGAHGDPVSYNLHKLSDFLLWKGALRYRAGNTDLTIGGRAASFGSTQLLITINGVLKDTVTLGDPWVSSIDISSGYADGDILQIEITTTGNNSKTSLFVVNNCFATPTITVATAWPGTLPTFSGIYTAADLQKLSTASEYLYERIASYPLLPHLGHVWRQGTHKIQDFVLWTGTVKRRNAGDMIRIAGNVTVNNTTEELIATIISPSATDVVSIGAWSGPGTTHTFDEFRAFPAGTAVGERAEITLVSHVTAAPAANPYNSLYNLLILRSEPTDAAQAPPASSTPNTNVTATTVNSRLNTIASMLTAIKTRIDASESFTWSRAMRYKYGFDDHQWEKFARTYPQTFFRRGRKLIVTGKNITLGFGAQSFEKDDDGNTTYNKYKLATEQTLISGEEVATKTIYLDSIPGLFPGTTYHLFGDVQYAAEEL